MNKLESIMKLAELGFTKDEIIAILHEPDPESSNQQETSDQRGASNQQETSNQRGTSNQQELSDQKETGNRPELSDQKETGNHEVTEDSIDAITNRILQKLALNIDHRANTPPEGDVNPVNDFYDNILKGVK